MIARGYAIAAFENAELAPDDTNRYREGVIQLFEGSGVGCAADKRVGRDRRLGLGRATGDGLLRDRAADRRGRASPSSATHAAGRRRSGPAPRTSGSRSSCRTNPGEGGAALSRRQFGETVERLTTTFPHWFAANYAGFARREDALPIDQHMLLALVAPRLLYVASADEDLWSDPRGEFLSLAEHRRSTACGAIGRSTRRHACARSAAGRRSSRVSRPQRRSQSHALRLGPFRGFRGSAVDEGPRPSVDAMMGGRCRLDRSGSFNSGAGQHSQLRSFTLPWRWPASMMTVR